MTETKKSTFQQVRTRGHRPMKIRLMLPCVSHHELSEATEQRHTEDICPNIGRHHSMIRSCSTTAAVVPCDVARSIDSYFITS